MRLGLFQPHPSLFRARNTSSMRQRRRSSRTISHAASASPASRLDDRAPVQRLLVHRRINLHAPPPGSSPPSPGSDFAGHRAAWIAGPASQGDHGDVRPGSPPVAVPTWTSISVSSGHAARLVDERHVSGRPLLRACGRPSRPRERSGSTPAGPTGEATVNVALAGGQPPPPHPSTVRRLVQPLAASASSAFLNRPLAPRRRFDGVLTGVQICAHPAGREQPPSRCRWRPGDE